MAQMKPVRRVLQSSPCRSAQVSTSAVPPNKRAGVEQEVHVVSDVWGEFLERGVEVWRGLHGAWMQGRGAMHPCLLATDHARCGLTDVFPQPLLKGLVGRSRC